MLIQLVYAFSLICIVYFDFFVQYYYIVLILYKEKPPNVLIRRFIIA